MTFLKKRTFEDHARITANYLLDGRHMIAKNIPSKNMYKYFSAMSETFSRLEDKLNEWVSGRILTKSTVFLPEWEKTAGIPDANFPGTGNVESRRRQAQTKLSADDMYTAEELEWLCSIMGFSVNVYSGHILWVSGDPRVSFSSEKESRFTTIFEVDISASNPTSYNPTFPVTFPWKFYSSDRSALEKFTLSLLDSNVNGVWIDSSEIGGIKDMINDGVTPGIKDMINDGVTLGIKDVVNI